MLAFEELAFILFGQGEWVVGGDGEDGGEERLLESVGVAYDILQEGLIVDTPYVIKR